MYSQKGPVNSYKAWILRVKLLVVAVETVNVALGHSTGTAHLETHGALVDTIVHIGQALNTNVLQGVLDTGNEVRNELGDGSAVKDGASDTLGNKDTVLLGEVASSTSVAGLAVLSVTTGLLILHGGDTAHATVGLDELALVADVVLTGRLGGTGKETAHHDSAGTHGKTLDDVADVLDTTIGDTGNTEASGEGCNAAHGSSLGTTNSHDLLGDTSTTAAHANSQAIDTGGNQSSSLLTGDDVTTDNVDLGHILLNVLDHLDLVHRVTLARIQNNNVQASLNKKLEALLVLLASTNGSGSDQLLGVGELRGQRVVEVLHQIRAGKQGDDVAVGINNGELSLLGPTEDFVGLGEGGAGGGSNKIRGHDGSHGFVEISVELNVTRGNHSNELGLEGSVLYVQTLAFAAESLCEDNIRNRQIAQIKSGSLQCNFRCCSGTKVIIKRGWSSCKVGGVGAGKSRCGYLTSDREATEAPLGLEVFGLTNGGLGGDDNGVQDETVLVSLNLADHLRLILGGAVVVNNTQTTEQSHVDSHVVLGDSVHGGGQKGSLQGDTLGNRGIQGDIGSGEACIG